MSLSARQPLAFCVRPIRLSTIVLLRRTPPKCAIADSPKSGDEGARIMGGVAIHPAAQRLPAPPKAGDELTDGDTAKYLMLQELVSHLPADESHIPDLYTRLEGSIDTKNKQTNEANGSDLFPKPLGNFKGLEVEWCFGYIEKEL